MTRVFLMIIAGVMTASAQAASDYQGPIIDTHAHIRFTDNDALKADQGKGTAPIRAVDQAAGVSVSALIVIARAGQMDKTRAQNDAVIAAAKADPDHFYPIASVHPADGAEAMTELDRMAEAGVKVIKLHPNTQNFDVSDPAVAAVVQHCGEKNLIVLFDSYKPWDTSEIGKFLLLAVTHPHATLILAHMGLTTFRDAGAFAMLRKIERPVNAYFDLSAIAPFYANSPVAPELVWTIRNIGVDRFLFGSDWPIDTPAVTRKAVIDLGFNAEEQRLIFHDNAAKLLGLR
jgi:predicted TIM-barrel fold metal-dependent hydrolase